MVIVQVGDLDKKQLGCLIYSLRSIDLLQDLAVSSELLFNCISSRNVQLASVSGALMGLERTFGFPLHLLSPILPPPTIKLFN